MHQLKKSILKNLNGYSWSIIIAFILASIGMEYNAYQISLERSLFSFPLIIIAVYWCESAACLLKKRDYELTRREAFNRDLFAISFSFFLACLLSLLFQYNNSDTKAWWSLYVYYIGLYGIIFSFLFSLIALIVQSHKIYTIVFSFIIVSVLSFSKFFPSYLFVVFIGKIDSYFVITCSLLIAHFLFFLGWRLSKLFFSGASR